MINEPLPPEAWAAEAARIADSLEDVAAAVIIGSDVHVALIVAIAIARAQRDGRRVAIGDLVGGLPGISARDGSPGLHECFRDGVPISDIARTLSEEPPIFALPSGDGDIAERWVFESARWTRLVAGFREVDALLLLVAPSGAPGLGSLINVVDGVVAVDLPPTVIRTWPLIATVDRPEVELPEIAMPSRAQEPVPAGAPRGKRHGRRLAGSAVLLAIVAAGVAFVMGGRDGPLERSTDGAPAAEVAGVPLAADGSLGAAAEALSEIMPSDTITLGPIVNPADSSIASDFAVELVAANTLTGANSRLAMRGEKLPAPTLAPVLLGSDGRPWFRALTGAWRQRAEAQDYLDALRNRGLVRQDVGRVLRVPFALQLADGVRLADVPASVAQWEAKGVPAYALVQDDGTARVYAGAFETSGQTAWLAKSLRDLGVVPVLAFRTGRTF